MLDDDGALVVADDDVDVALLAGANHLLPAPTLVIVVVVVVVAVVVAATAVAAVGERALAAAAAARALTFGAILAAFVLLRANVSTESACFAGVGGGRTPAAVLELLVSTTTYMHRVSKISRRMIVQTA